MSAPFDSKMHLISARFILCTYIFFTASLCPGFSSLRLLCTPFCPSSYKTPQSLQLV